MTQATRQTPGCVPRLTGAGRLCAISRRVQKTRPGSRGHRPAARVDVPAERLPVPGSVVLVMRLLLDARSLGPQGSESFTRRCRRR